MKRTIVILANGFGIESKSSTYGIKDESLATINKLNSEYLSTSLFASGKDVAYSSQGYADFQIGYRAFSAGGKIPSNDRIVSEAIKNGTFISDEIKEVFSHLKTNNSKLHLYFPIGNKVSHNAIDHLKELVSKANNESVKEILIHLILGFNSDSNIKEAKDHIKVINRILEGFSNWSIASLVGINNISDTASVNSLAKFYRVNTTTVAEIWPDPLELLDTRYKEKVSEANVISALTSRRQIYEDNDALLFVNYEELAIEKYISMLLYPDKVFTYGYLPKNLKITSLFPLSANTNIPSGFNYALPEFYFAKALEGTNKKISLITDEKRAPFIMKTLNGHREGGPNIEYKIVKVINKQMQDIISILIQELKTSTSDLLIADLNLLDDYTQNNVQKLEENIKILDQQILRIFEETKDKGDSLIITSLYGLKEELTVNHKNYVLNFSEKVPFIMIDREKSKNTAFVSGTSINDLASTIFNHLGMPGYKSFILMKKGASKGKANLIYAILILLIIAMLLKLFVF